MEHSSSSLSVRCISDGVDVLNQCGSVPPGLPIRRVASFLCEQTLRVLPPADKEGGFAVLPCGTFISKSRKAIASVFNSHPTVCLSKLKSSAKKPCRLHLPALVKTIDKSKRNCLNVFFSAKTHKVDVPLRTIVSESGTWQHSVAHFLQRHLNVLSLDDPFIVCNSTQVLEYFKVMLKRASSPSQST